jgi:hypothetical protein
VRYYSITITDPESGFSYIPNPNGSGFLRSGNGPTFTSYANGVTLPGALDIELDMPVVAFNSPQGSHMIRVWGVGLQMIGQAADLNGAKIVVSAGMQKGLPLANPKQAGIIVQGSIYQAFGNWQGTNQTLDLVLQSSDLSPPQGISFKWQAGTTLESALKTTFTQAFPAPVYSPPDIRIASNLQPPLGADQPGTYDSLSQFAAALLSITQGPGRATYGDSYPGVQLTIVGNTIKVFDGTQPPAVVQLDFWDLIGQPTWINPGMVNFKTVMRSDIAVGSSIRFPQGVLAPFALTSPQAAAPNAPARSRSVFQGVFSVVEAHHFGRFRQADANSWNTTFNAVPLPDLPTVGP